MKKILLLGSLSWWAVATLAGEPATAARQDRLAQSPPRKVVVATACHWFSATMDADERAATIERLGAEAVAEASRLFPSTGLDLFVLPEHALQRRGVTAAERALRLDQEPVRRVVALAARHRTWLVLPMILNEEHAGGQVFSNAAVLVDRTGKVAGIYRKTHPLAAADGSFENGLSPGGSYPIFATDFGHVGIQICWDMAYDEGWAALAAGGAELVVLPSASPQNVRPAAYAQRYRYWVVNSTPRDNVSVFNPLGLAEAQRTTPGVLVHRFDLVSVVAHWSPRIEEGRAFRQRFGDRGGFTWSSREDAGLFWSNDARTPVGMMLRELGVESMDAQVERIGAELARTRARPRS
jgi:predicted amidohydrolase